MCKEISLCIMTRKLCHELYKDWQNDPDIYMDMGLFAPYHYDGNAVNLKNTRSQHILEKLGFRYTGEKDGFKYYRYVR